MAVTITFNFNDAQQARIQQARDSYNQSHGTTLTPKQYLLLLIKSGVTQETIQPTLDDALAAAQAAVEAAIQNDLTGNA